MGSTNTTLHIVFSPGERLAALEATIQQHLEGFIAVGLALTEIHDDQLYRHKNAGQYQTFEDYCKAVWGMGRAQGYRLIEAAKVADNLSPIGDIAHLTEGVVRPLTRLRDPDQQRAVYARAVAHAETEHRVVAARDVQAFVREVQDDHETTYSPIIKPSDNWHFNPIVYGKLALEEEQPHGYVCGDFYANCLWYYSNPGDVVVDSMAGSGQLWRVYQDRARWMIPDPWELEVHLFDLTPRGPYQDRIHQHDVRASFPLPHADYIMLDPPYPLIVKGQYSTKTDDLSNMDLPAWLSAMDDIARSCSSAQEEGGRCTVVMPNHRNFMTKAITLSPHLVTDVFLRHGYDLFDKAYMSLCQQQEEGVRAAMTNIKAKQRRRMRNEIAEVLTFLRIPISYDRAGIL